MFPPLNMKAAPVGLQLHFEVSNFEGKRPVLFQMNLALQVQAQLSSSTTRVCAGRACSKAPESSGSVAVHVGFWRVPNCLTFAQGRGASMGSAYMYSLQSLLAFERATLFHESCMSLDSWRPFRFPGTHLGTHYALGRWHLVGTLNLYLCLAPKSQASLTKHG